MGGHSSNSGGDTGPANRYSTPKKKVVDFIKGGGVVGYAVRAITKNIKETKAKKAKQNALDYEGDALGTKSANTYTTPTDNDRGVNDNALVMDQAIVSKKSTEQPKVKAQMNNTNETTTKGPTSVEMTSDEKLSAAKRKGRKTTVLTSITGVEEKATLSKKKLLG